MPSTRSDHDNAATLTANARRRTVLIVDDEQVIRQALGDALATRRVRIIEAGSVAEARQVIESIPVDVALVDVQLPDGDGLDLASTLHEQQTGVESIVITGDPTLPRAVQAIRAGVCDFLSKPLNLDELDRCVERAMQRRSDNHRHNTRVQRLRRLCRKLHRARSQVTQQVDILCNDLVTAYQELADQMKQVQCKTQFAAALENELDLETVLRRLLEAVLQQAGSTNAVVFMPARGIDGHTVGGYVNYTFDKGTAEVLLDHLADVAAPRIDEADDLLHFTNDAELDLWLNEDSNWLTGSHVLAVPCRNGDETLASLLLFRDASEPYSPQAIEAMRQLAGVFAAHLVKVIRVHHRHLDHGDDLPA